MKAFQSKVKTRVGASKLSKDKTRFLYFCPTIDLIEKVFEYLLPVDDAARCAMTPEDMVRHLANKNIQDVLTSFQAVEISGKIRKPFVLASEASAKFASAQFKLHEHIFFQFSKRVLCLFFLFSFLCPFEVLLMICCLTSSATD